MRGLNAYPRLIEFQNSRFVTDDFERPKFNYLTVIGDATLEFAHYNPRHWATPEGEIITIGEMIKRIYGVCSYEAFLRLYVQDVNPAFPRRMFLNKIFIYKLSVGDKYMDCRNRIKQGYNLECEDDVKVFNNLGQAWEVWRTHHPA